MTASSDKTARVWDAETGKPLGAPLQQGASVNSAAFSPDGRRAVTASSDNTARLWDEDAVRPKGTANYPLSCCVSDVEANRLASLAEAVGGYDVSDAGSLTFIGLDEQRRRLKELQRLSGTGPVPRLSVEWLIRQFPAK